MTSYSLEEGEAKELNQRQWLIRQEILAKTG